ncbi:hypothetical protein KQI63_12285 [bacterium]|nr:hypothetical protein [bacterium]
MTMLSDGKRILLLLAVSMLLVGGCNDNDGPIDPPSDPAEALKAQAIVFDSQFFLQIDVVRTDLNLAQLSLSPFNPLVERTEQTLSSLVNGSASRVWWSGVIDAEGFVRNVFPDSMERFVDVNRIEIPAVDSVLREERIDAGPVIIQEDGRRAIDYYRSIMDQGNVVGAVFAGLALDTLIDRSMTYIDFSDSTGYHLFMLDDLGQIVHDYDPTLIGLNVYDTERFGEITPLVEDLYANTEGSGRYTLVDLGAGGAGENGIEGEYYIGWIRREYLEDHFLIFAITQLDEASNQKMNRQP